MESFTKLLLFVTGIIVAVSLIEAVVLSRRKSASSPFAWHEVWISLFDLAARRLMSSSAPDTGMPRLCEPGRPRSCRVVINPG